MALFWVVGIGSQKHGPATKSFPNRSLSREGKEAGMTMKLYESKRLRRVQPAKDQFYERCGHTSKICLPAERACETDVLFWDAIHNRFSTFWLSFLSFLETRLAVPRTLQMRLTDRNFQEKSRSVWNNPRRFSAMNFRATKFRNPIRSWRTGQTISC